MNGHLLNGFAVPVGVNHTKSDANNKKKLINFNDKVTSHIEYAKLFLKKDMRDFSAFDETCDASVVLCLFGKIDSFPAALQNAANHVQKGRDIWVRYKSSEWNDDGFQDRFHDMTQLVKEVGLSPSDKCKVLEGLSTYKRRGNYYLPLIGIRTVIVWFRVQLGGEICMSEFFVRFLTTHECMFFPNFTRNHTINYLIIIYI